LQNVRYELTAGYFPELYNNSFV